jgi:hypothetical protein
VTPDLAHRPRRPRRRAPALARRLSATRHLASLAGHRARSRRRLPAPPVERGRVDVARELRSGAAAQLGRGGDRPRRRGARSRSRRPRHYERRTVAMKPDFGEIIARHHPGRDRRPGPTDSDPHAGADDWRRDPDASTPATAGADAPSSTGEEALMAIRHTVINASQEVWLVEWGRRGINETGAVTRAVRSPCRGGAVSRHHHLQQPSNPAGGTIRSRAVGGREGGASTVSISLVGFLQRDVILRGRCPAITTPRHSITWSARGSSDGGIVRPSALS